MSISGKRTADLADKIKTRSAAAEIRKYVPLQMTFWSEKSRALANELLRSSLWSCRDGRKPRKYFNNEALFVLGEGAITYKGEELRSRDESIFNTLTHGARDLPSGQMIVRVTSSQICKENRWRQDQRFYKEIFLSIQRMKASAITVFSRRLAKALRCQEAIDRGASEEELTRLYDELENIARSSEGVPLDVEAGPIAGMMLSLISGDPVFTGATAVINDIPQGNLTWEITLDKKMVSLFAKPYITLVDSKIRHELTPTGRRLQAYYMSHSKPYPVKLRSLEKMMGVSFGNIRHLKAHLVTEFEALKKYGVIVDFSMVKSADEEDYLVHVSRSEATQLPLNQS